MEKVTVKLSKEDLALLENGSETQRETLIQKTFESLEENDIRSLLSGFCNSEDRETYDPGAWVHNVEFNDSISGILVAGFTCSAYFGCKDQNYTDERDTTVQFQLLIKESKIEFATDPPDKPGRSTDDDL